MPCRRSLLAAFLPLLAAVAAPAASAAVRHVDVATGSDTVGCGAAASPCASIQQAVNLSQSGDRILVAAGVYTYQPARDPCPSSDTGVVCVVDRELAIVGGFDDGDWSSSDPEANPTVIDGEGGHRGVLVTRTFPGAPAAGLELVGFTVRNGRAFGGLGPPDGDNGHGGGLKAAHSDLVVRDVVFRDNRAIGADNASGAGGAALGAGLFSATEPTASPGRVVLQRVRFEGNQALGGTGSDRGGLGQGGGMLVNFANLTAVDVVLNGNLAVAGGSPGSGLSGGLRADGLGGGMSISHGVTARIERLTAIDNVAAGGSAGGASGSGGGAFGGGVYAEGSATAPTSVTISDSSLRTNQALAADAGNGTGGLGVGGGLMAFDASLDLQRSELIGNRAVGGDGQTKGSAGGGGAYLERAGDLNVQVTLADCIVADNAVVLGSGGGVVGGGGGGLFLLGNDALLRHLTLARNTLSTSPLVGQAVVVVNRLSTVSEATIEHSIISDHTSLANNAAVQVQGGAEAHFLRPLFADNARDTNQGFGSHGTITGLETALAAADAGYVSPGFPDFDYHLTLASPAVDEAPASQEVFDVDGSRRGSPRDLGADEICRAADDDLLLADVTLNGTDVAEACESITVRDYTVAASGDLTVQAGRNVVLENGFRVLTGGRLSILNTLP